MKARHRLHVITGHLAAEESVAVSQKKVLENKELLALLREEAISWAAAHGLTMAKDADSGLFVHAPLTLLPSLVPRKVYQQVQSTVRASNLLLDRISRDHDFLTSTLAKTAKADPEFTGRLFDIYQTVHKEGHAQPLQLGLHRNDFMLDASKGETVPLQVEFNSIAASFGNLSNLVSLLHEYLILRHVNSPLYHHDNLPRNQTLERIPSALATAFFLHPHRPKDVRQGVIVMVIQPGEKNSSDQRWIEYGLWERHGLSLIRRSLREIEERGTLTADKDLIIDGYVAVVVYFRAGYVPKDYPSDKEWASVLKIERSRAIKCPSVAYHLAGTKKVQQALAAPGVLERFLDKKDANKVRKSFAGLWSLDNDDDETKRIIKEATKNPDDYVLKPQREGGGNNLWGSELVQAINGPLSERSAFILMQRIKPSPNVAVLMRDGKVEVAECHNELGVYSSFISDGDIEYLNEGCGHLVRTKKVGTNEGGVAAGFAVLDSPLLY